MPQIDLTKVLNRPWVRHTHLHEVSMEAEAEKRKPDVEWPRILVGLPMGQGGCPPETFMNFIQLAYNGHRILKVEGRVDVNRNRLMFKSREEGYTHVLMLDIDHCHPPDIVKRLARWVIHDPTKLVVAGRNFRRSEPYDPQVYDINDEDKLSHILEWEGDLIQVKVVGASAMLIDLRVMDIIPAPWFWNDYSSAAEGRFPGEDIGFCKKCLEYGVKVWCDMTAVSPHRTVGLVGEEVFEAYRKTDAGRALWENATKELMSREAVRAGKEA